MAFDIANALQPATFNPSGVMQAVQSNRLAQAQDARAQAEATMRSTEFQNQLADRAAAQQQGDAKTALATAQYVLQSQQPKALLQSLSQTNPKVAEFLDAATAHHGIDWNSATDQDIRGMAQTLIAHYGSQLGEGPPVAKPQSIAPGGSLVTVGQDASGNPTASPLYTAPAKPEGLGTMYQYIDPASKKPVFGTAEQAQGQTPYNKPSAGDSYSPSSVETTAQMIVNNQIPMLTGFSLKTPWGQAVVARVGQLAPAIVGQSGSGYQGAVYGARSSALKDFTSGTSSRTVRSLNVAIAHLGTLGDLAGALDNGDTQLLNKVSVIYKTQTGNPAPTNFAGARSIVANEIVKAVTASGGGVTDRQEAQAEVSAANSPAQLAGVIQTWKQLLGGQLGGLKQQYEQGTNNRDFNRFLSPEVISQLEQGDSGASPPAAPPSEVTATGPNGQKLALRNGQWVPK